MYWSDQHHSRQGHWQADRAAVYVSCGVKFMEVECLTNCENKYVMRFPNASMVRDWSKCKALMMNDVDALMKVEPWSPKIGAKAMLQTAWFRVSEIPGDQRSIRTIAKVRGLVGKVMEIDEKTRYRADYVRVRIACRDLQKVPAIVEGCLGICVHDFGFEREAQEESTIKTLTSGIKVG